MTPSIDDRLASLVRALTEVILPHLPPEASLAQEQTQLAIGHIQIIRAQLDAAPEYEREELDDAVAVANELAGQVSGGLETTSAVAAMRSAVGAVDGSDVRNQRQQILDCIDALVKAVARDGDATARKAMALMIVKHEHARTQKDRQWFAPFGFDTL